MTHRPENAEPDQPADQDSAPESGTKKPTLYQRIPRRLFGGHVRTTTAVLVVIFFAALILYGQRSEHYDQIDEKKRQTQVSNVQQPRTTTPKPAEETSTPIPEPSVTTTPSTEVPSSVGESASSSSEAPAPSETQVPQGGFSIQESPTVSTTP